MSTTPATTPDDRPSSPIRIALLSFWHVHAADYARQALEHPETELVAIWDENPERGQAEANARNVPFVADLEAIWNDPTIHGVILTSATREHRRLLVAAANSGKHIFTEKVIAATTSEALEAVTAIERASVKWMVSLPGLYSGSTRAVRDVIASGRLGQVTQVRVRVSHSGLLPSNGQPHGWLPERFSDPLEAQGGAMIDFGVHPMYLTRLFLGMPDQVSAMYGRITGHAVEDNAVAVLHHSSGAVGIVEAGFVNPHDWFSIEVHGTEALLHFGAPTGGLSVSTNAAGRASSWEVLEVPADGRSPFEHWVRHVLHEDDHSREVSAENQRIALDVTTLMEASNSAARSGQTVKIKA